jgi:glycine/D-amino acid oxidase-like deaminating enzyme
MTGLLTDDFVARPYWWDRTPPPPSDEAPLPPRVDVAVVGSGYTGLGAALETARGGRDTLVLEAESLGWGCSTRNGGQVSTSVKPGFAALARAHGAERARAILALGRASLDWIGTFVAAEGIDCDFRVAGRFHGAHSRAAFARIAAAAREMPPGEAEVVPEPEVGREIATETYRGGVVYHRHAALDPARFHAGLLARVRAAGTRVEGHARVGAIEREDAGFVLETARGAVRARDVVVATNGYSAAAMPWLRRRVIPIGSYIVATEPLEPGLVGALLPTGRVVSDTRRVVYYYRASPDGRRILFGGRVSGRETDPRVSAPALHAEMVRVFPQLAGVRISHSWMGFVAYTFDTLAHVGEAEGVHYAAGYCGSGVAMAPYLGTRVGLKLLGRAEGRTALEGLAFPARAYYRGNPWFLAPSVMAYRWLDRLGI